MQTVLAGTGQLQETTLVTTAISICTSQKRKLLELPLKKVHCQIDEVCSNNFLSSTLLAQVVKTFKSNPKWAVW